MRAGIPHVLSVHPLHDIIHLSHPQYFSGADGVVAGFRTEEGIQGLGEGFRGVGMESLEEGWGYWVTEERVRGGLLVCV